MIQLVLQVVHLYSVNSLQPKKRYSFRAETARIGIFLELHTDMSNPLFQLLLHHLVEFLQKQQVLLVCLSLGVVFRNSIVMGKYFYVTFTSVVLASPVITARSLHRMPHNFFWLIYRLTRFISFVFRPETT